MADEDLFGEDDLGVDPFSDAGAALEEREPETRRPGRPKGSMNRKTKEFEKYFQARGFRDPLVAMAHFLTADPVALQAWFQKHDRSVTAIGKKVLPSLPSLMEIIKEQHAVASHLAPYLHGKKPAEIAIIDERLPTLIIELGTNQLEEAERIHGQSVMSLGTTLEAEPNKINDLEGEGE